jgi:hypothetical protein
VWWVGCHGGAGTTTLATVTGIGADMGVGWPTPVEGCPPIQVVLVCRVTASALWAATGAVNQWKRRALPASIRVMGLVGVAASARKPPRRAVERWRLLAGWLPAVWRVGWVEEYLAVDHAPDIGVPPDVAALQHALTSQTRPT